MQDRSRRSGKPLWTFTTHARVDSSLAIAGGRVFVGSNDGRVYGLDLAGGKKVWEYEAASPVTSSPAVARRLDTRMRRRWWPHL